MGTKIPDTGPEEMCVVTKRNSVAKTNYRVFHELGIG